MNKMPWPTWPAALILFLGAADLHASADAFDQARAVADCREEGRAGGLEGPALEEFVAECVRELQQVEIRNLER
jgi:hypothetical protein